MRGKEAGLTLSFQLGLPCFKEARQKSRAGVTEKSLQNLFNNSVAIKHFTDILGLTPCSWRWLPEISLETQEI